MAWYSYFLLNVPEAFSQLLLTFVLLGIPIKENRKSIIWFSFIHGVAAFTLNSYMTNSLKPLLLMVIFSILIAIIFKMKIINSFIIGLFAVVIVVLFELIFVIGSNLLSINIEMLLENPWNRIVVGFCVITLPMLIMAWIIKKLKISIKIPVLFK